MIRHAAQNLCGLIALCLSFVAPADEIDEPLISVGGLMFGDLYYVPNHHLDDGDGAIGFVVRRGYLTFGAKPSENTFSKMRFELNQSGEFETYTYEVRFKDLYLGWNIGRHQLIAGLSPTPTFDLIESFWAARYLARTPMDIQGIASRDTGIALRGPLNASGSVRYRAMLGSGIEFGADSTDGSKWMAAVSWEPAPGWTMDFYVDFEDLQNTHDRLTLQAFAAYQNDTTTWGFQYSNQDRGNNPSIELASVFAVKILNENTRFLGRIDHLFEPSPKGDDIAYLPMDPTARATMFFAGIQFQVSPHWSLTPNTVVTYYGHNDLGQRPETDVYLRLTLFANYE